MKKFRQWFVPLYFAISLATLSCTTISSKATDQGPLSQYCSPQQGAAFLPSYFAAKDIFIGLTGEASQNQIIRKILLTSANLTPQPNITVLVPQIFLNPEYGQVAYIDRLSRTARSQVLVVPGEDSLWIQDYFEPLIDLGKDQVEIVEAPYDAQAEQILRTLTWSKKLDLVQRPVGFDIGENGDSGGNIEPLASHLLGVGNNMNPRLVEHLKGLTHQNIISLNTAWLEPGHVDELFMTVPSHTSSDQCHFSLIYASPKRAIDLLAASPPQKNQTLGLYDEVFESESEGRKDFRKCIHEIDWKTGTAKSSNCRAFLKANLEYHHLIQTDLAKLEAELKKDPLCRFEGAVALPVLFSPFKVVKNFGTIADRGMALNPNPVNGISLGRSFLTSAQVFPAFQQDIETSFKQLGLNYLPTKADHLFSLRGGIHCASNIVRSCQQYSHQTTPKADAPKP